jgi:hypothetical protein
MSLFLSQNADEEIEIIVIVKIFIKIRFNSKSANPSSRFFRKYIFTLK